MTTNLDEEAFEEVNLFLRRILKDPRWGTQLPRFFDRSDSGHDHEYD